MQSQTKGNTKTQTKVSQTPGHLELFSDTSELVRRGVLIDGPIYEGSPQSFGCWGCPTTRRWTHAISWGNSGGPAVSLPICTRCYVRRSRLCNSDRLLFDQTCRQRVIDNLDRLPSHNNDMGVKA